MAKNNCCLSLMRKRCPRYRFPCSRCGAKIVNGELQWEITVPQYKRWYYMHPGTLAVNDAADAGPVTLTAPDVVSYSTPEKAKKAPCTFDGPKHTQEARILKGTTPADYGAFVSDFEYDRWEGTVLEPSAPWVYFRRTHSALVSWKEAEEDGSKVITPGCWKVTVTIKQAALWFAGVPNPGSYANYAPGGGFGARIEFYNSDLVGDPFIPPEWSPEYDELVTTNDYFAPADFPCPAQGDTYRFTREIPTEPSEYNQDYDHYPVNNDYYAPPYIDVRHISK